MKLQYVFEGNPRKKAAPKKKSKKSLGARNNPSKLKEGGRMAKKRPTKAQLAARAKFVAKYAKNPKKRKKRGKRKNPETVIIDAPVYKRRALRRPSQKDIDYRYLEKQMLDQATAEEEKAYNALSPAQRDFLVSSRDKSLFRKTLKRAAQAAKSEASLSKKRARSVAEEKELISKGGKLVMVKENPRKRRKKRAKKQSKRRKHKRNPAANYGMVTVGNPRRRRKKKHAANPKRRRKHKRVSDSFKVAFNPRKKKKKHAKKRKHAKRRKAKRSSSLFVGHGSMKLTPAKKRHIKRKRALRYHVRINPNPKAMLVKYGSIALAGAAYPWFNYGVGKLLAQIDTLSGGMVTKVTGQINAQVPGLAAPLIGGSLAIGIKMLDEKHGFVAKVLGAEGSKIVDGVLDVLAVLAAAEIGRVSASYLKLDPAGMGMSGVTFYPGAPLGAADFGMLGDGYHQQPGDFGGVKYFPGAAMGAVEYYPQGANGDQSFQASLKDQMQEAQSLGIIPEGLGIIPEGLGSADFGLIPEGLSGDEGQMG